MIYYDERLHVVKKIENGRIHGLESGCTNHGEREERGAEGVGCGDGVSPPHRGRGMGRGLCPFPEFFK